MPASHGVAAAPFSLQLREATDESHRTAETSPFVVELIEGRLPRDEYARLVVQLGAVYGELEAAVSAATDETVAPFLRRELDRVAALGADLDFLLGPDWADRAEVLPATQAYCDRIRSASAASSAGLVAHHYVRYMGDLSGGQMLGRVVQRVYELPDGLGTTAYHFDAIESPKRFKEEYRALLDATPWSDAERAHVIDEAIVAFACNAAVFEDLSRQRA